MVTRQFESRDRVMWLCIFVIDLYQKKIKNLIAYQSTKIHKVEDLFEAGNIHLLDGCENFVDYVRSSINDWTRSSSDFLQFVDSSRLQQVFSYDMLNFELRISKVQ